LGLVAEIVPELVHNILNGCWSIDSGSTALADASKEQDRHPVPYSNFSKNEISSWSSTGEESSFEGRTLQDLKEFDDRRICGVPFFVSIS